MSMLFPILFSLVLVFGPAFALIILFARSLRDVRNAVQNRVFEENANAAAATTSFRVNYRSDGHFRSASAWRCGAVHPASWEGTGVLFIGNEKAMFVGSNLTTHESMNIEFELGETGVRWIGRTLFRKGGVSWLQIDFRDKKHFFSAETGITNLGSKAKTRALFEECCRASKSASVTSSHAPM